MKSEHPVIEAISSRRSVRKFEDAPVPKQQLEIIVDCGRLAPSAMNRQTWAFVVVTKREILGRIAKAVTINGPFIADAGACIVVCTQRDNRSRYIDGSAAVENMLLAAHGLGYGTCWVQGFEKPYNKEVKEVLGIPSDYDLVALVPVGVPAQRPSPPPKRPLEHVLHWERFERRED